VLAPQIAAGHDQIPLESLAAKSSHLARARATVAGLHPRRSTARPHLTSIRPAPGPALRCSKPPAANEPPPLPLSLASSSTGHHRGPRAAPLHRFRLAPHCPRPPSHHPRGTNSLARTNCELPLDSLLPAASRSSACARAST
jgi:hypothetical protein